MMNKKHISYGLLLFTNIIICALIFGEKLFHINSLSLGNYYDVMKNYFTLLYYTAVQEDHLLLFEGMLYPFKESIIYTDNTPLLAIVCKLLGLQQYSIGLFHLFLIINLFVSPFIAFRIGEKLNFHPVSNFIFSFFIVWLHPELFNLYSSANLSITSFFLGAFLLLINIYLKKEIKGSLLFIGLLVMCSSFIHLYYFILLGFIFFFGLIPIIFKNKKKAFSSYTTLISSMGMVYLIIRIIDPYYSMRPKGGLGFNYHLWRSDLSNFFKSYQFLDFPSLWKHENYNPDWFSFLGSAALPAILVIIIYVILNRQLVSKYKDIKLHLYLGILITFIISSFTALGNDIHLFGKDVFNFLNPLYLMSFITEKFNNFRFLSRFNFISFIAANILIFKGLSYILNSKNRVKHIVYLLLFIYAFDSYQLMKYHQDAFLKHPSLLSKSALENVRLFDEKYDAILPIPYFNVGCENHSYTIDDNDDWSKEIFQYSIKNKTPLLANKMSRTPPEIVYQYFSLFSDEINPELYDKLRGKKIIIIKSKIYDSRKSGLEPAKHITENKDIFIELNDPRLIDEDQKNLYYEMEFN